MGRYLRRMYRLLAMPADGIPIGLLRPADSPALVRTLARQRLQELTAAAAVPHLDPTVQSEIAARRFHTFEDFLFMAKRGRPGRNEPVAYGHSLDRDDDDAAGYLNHIRQRDRRSAVSSRRRRKRRSGAKPSTPRSISPAKHNPAKAI